MKHPQSMSPAEIAAYRESFAGKGAVKRELDGGLVVYVTAGARGPAGKAFSGKALKPAWNYWFRDDAKLEAHIASWAAGMQRSAEYKAKCKAERKAPHSLVVGDILHSSWGFDQTNNDYFQVTKLIGARMVEIHEIGASYVSSGWCVGHSTPIADSFKPGKAPMRKLVIGNAVRIASYTSASKWSGRPSHESSYA